VLISQLAEIGFDTIYDELKQADVAWVLVALILAQSSFIGSGISVRGAVATPLPLLPCVLLQSAIKFINLTVPSSAGRIGLNLRFLQQQGARTRSPWEQPASPTVSTSISPSSCSSTRRPPFSPAWCRRPAGSARPRPACRLD
jgi:hypothetical protein